MTGLSQFLAHHVDHDYRDLDRVEMDPDGVGGPWVYAQGRPRLAAGRGGRAALMTMPCSIRRRTMTDTV